MDQKLDSNVDKQKSEIVQEQKDNEKNSGNVQEQFLRQTAQEKAEFPAEKTETPGEAEKQAADDFGDSGNMVPAQNIQSQLLDTSPKFDSSIVPPHFDTGTNFFGKIGGIYNDAGHFENQNLHHAVQSPYGFQDYKQHIGNNFYPDNYGGNFDTGTPNEVFGYDMGAPPLSEVAPPLGYGSGHMAYPEMSMLPNEEFGVSATPDRNLRPAALSDIDLRKELSVRGLQYVENDRVSNIARLVSYLLENNLGDGNLSSEHDELIPPVENEEPHGYSYLEVILINCDAQRKPLLDWLETWKNASRDVNTAEIYELAENNLIKIRIFNKFSEPSGVIEQLNSVKIKCARYFCHSRGDNWGGWEYYEGGFLQKQESYSAQQPPPRFWRRLCWLENIDACIREEGEKSKLRAADLTPQQVCAVLGTNEEMICVECGNFEKTCLSIHGNFNGHFKSPDLYSRYSVLMADE